MFTHHPEHLCNPPAGPYTHQLPAISSRIWLWKGEQLLLKMIMGWLFEVPLLSFLYQWMPQDSWEAATEKTHSSCTQLINFQNLFKNYCISFAGKYSWLTLHPSLIRWELHVLYALVCHCYLINARTHLQRKAVPNALWHLFLLFSRTQFSEDWVILSHLVFMVYSLS